MWSFAKSLQAGIQGVDRHAATSLADNSTDRNGEIFAFEKQTHND
jgi:hypothetical protein